MSEKIHVNDFEANQATIKSLTAEFIKLKNQIEILSNELRIVKDSKEVVKISSDRTDINNALYLKGILASPVPLGTIVAYYADVIPEGWALCDGHNGTPDLRNAFIMGGMRAFRNTHREGAESVKLSADNLPAHSHTYYDTRLDRSKRGSVEGGLDEKGKTFYVQSVWETIGVDRAKDHQIIGYDRQLANTGVSGSGTSFPILPTHIKLAYIMKIR